MKVRIGIIIGCLLHISGAYAQTSQTLAVMIEAEANSETSEVTLSWVKDDGATGYEIYRKEKGSSTWGDPVKTLNGDAISYTENVAKGEEKEYFVRKFANGFEGSGFVIAGVETELVEFRGTCLLLVEEDLANALGASMDTLITDLVGSGYTVDQRSVKSTASHVIVKQLIDDAVSEDDEVTTVYILGHVPVPYSGQFCNHNFYSVPPDGHGPGQGNHCGAWPADVYYAMDYENWLDEDSVTDVVNRELNKNIPNDEKWDEIRLPGEVSLQVGRVDFSDLPAFSESELELTKRYIRKVHGYKNFTDIPVSKALVTENFPTAFGFASTAWRNFPAMVGADQIEEKDFFTTLTDTTYIFAYGTGPGSFSSAGGIGNTADFTTKNGAMFNMLFGSYFGDWDSRNNFMRASLASKKGGLICAWSGRPFWQFHPMAFNETSGYSARLTQNNKNTYSFNVFENAIHIALMGDPTLDLHRFEPVTDFFGTPNRNMQVAELTWSASESEDVIGYNIYYSHQKSGPFYRANKDLITDTSFMDEAPYDGTVFYMIRTVRLENTRSGSFFNMSQGQIIQVDGLDPLGIEAFQSLESVKVYPNPASNKINISFNKFSGSKTELILTDLQGKSIYNELHKGSGKQLVSVDVSSLPRGVYILRIGNYAQKVLLQ